jgi:hypothetical protein
MKDRSNKKLDPLDEWFDRVERDIIEGMDADNERIAQLERELEPTTRALSALKTGLEGMMLAFLGFIVPGVGMMGCATGAGLDDTCASATW